MNSEANSQNPLKRVEEFFICFLEPFMGLRDEPWNSFQGGMGNPREIRQQHPPRLGAIGFLIAKGLRDLGTSVSCGALNL
jgi:hypothetical protein